MCKVIAICNQKGGVSKTTTTVSLGLENPDELEIALPSIMEKIIMGKDFDVAEGIIHHKEGIDIMPCNIDLFRCGCVSC